MSEENFTIIRPFGPSIAKLKLPNEIIYELNKFADEIISNQEKSIELDHGKNLAGNVKQEFRLTTEIMKSSGLANFLANGVSKWLEISDKQKIKNFKIISSWIVRQFQNEYNPIHHHDGHISGVGYLKLPKSYGSVFQNTKTNNPNGQISFIHGVKIFNSSSSVNVKPEIGDFYLFPHYLMHTVYPFYGDEERRSISFNAKIDDDVYNVYS